MAGIAVSDFGTVLTQTTLELRAIAESNMTDTCIITRAGQGKGPWNEATGQYDPPADVTIYSGKCRLQIKSVANASDSNAGDRQATVQEAEWQGPVLGTETVAINDVIKMQTCVLDPSLEDREFTVKGRHGKSQATTRRLRVEEVTG